MCFLGPFIPWSLILNISSWCHSKSHISCLCPKQKPSQSQIPSWGYHSTLSQGGRGALHNTGQSFLIGLVQSSVCLFLGLRVLFLTVQPIIESSRCLICEKSSQENFPLGSSRALVLSRLSRRKSFFITMSDSVCLGLCENAVCTGSGKKYL